MYTLQNDAKEVELLLQNFQVEELEERLENKWEAEAGYSEKQGAHVGVKYSF